MKSIIQYIKESNTELIDSYITDGNVFYANYRIGKHNEYSIKYHMNTSDGCPSYDISKADFKYAQTHGGKCMPQKLVDMLYDIVWYQTIVLKYRWNIDKKSAKNKISNLESKESLSTLQQKDLEELKRFVQLDGIQSKFNILKDRWEDSIYK